MRTEDLIEAIARDGAAPRPRLAGRMAAALVAGGAASYALLQLELGLRPDLASALTTWRFALKVAVTALLCAAAYWAAAGLSHPTTTLRNVAVALLAAPVVLALGVGYELMTLPAAEWSARAIGVNARICLASVPLLSIAPLAAMLAALRTGAPRSATIAGAVAGLVAGGAGATLYALHCHDDSPLFVALWYALSVALVALVGALLGRWLLRW
jgi:hypothetical protein